MLLHLLMLVPMFLLLIWLIKYWTSGLPLGPVPLPVIGNLHQVMSKGSGKVHLTLTELGKKYGEIYTVYIGGTPWIIVNGYQAIKESKQGSLLTGVPKNVVLDNINQRMGIVGSEGKVWQEQRRFAVVHLPELGFGKVSYEDKIQEEVTALLKTVQEEGGTPFNIRILLTNAVANIICSIVLGRRYEYTDSTFQTFLHAVNSNFEIIAKASTISAILPWVRFLPGDVLNYKRIMGNVDKLVTFLKGIIDEHKTTLDEGNIRDFIDSYLVKIQQENEKQDTSTFTDAQLTHVIEDLFVAGLETTSTSLYWALLFLILYPDIQRKARQEIDDVVGRNRLASVRDRQNLPYMEALMAEVFRVGNIAAIGLFHCPGENINLSGYNIPARTTVVTNFTSVMTDKHLYKNPDTFDPKRFLDDNGKFIKPEWFVPFSLGRRCCLGESLARMESFLFLTTMLQRFTFSVPDSGKSPSSEGVNGLTLCPRPYELCANLREG